MSSDSIVGKWEMVSSDKYEEYLKAAGVGVIQRNIAAKAHPKVEWLVNDGKWTQKTATVMKNFEITFVPGVEFDEELADGRKAKSVVVIEGNKLTHKANAGGTESVVTRVFNGNEMVSTFTCGGVTATRVFKRM